MDKKIRIKITKIFSVVFLTILILGLLWIFVGLESSLPKGNKIVEININNKIVRAEVVFDDEKMQKGLGGRDSICIDCGMLFQFQEPGIRYFWMKGMKFPLDIIWLRNGTIVHIEREISENDSRTFSYNNDVDMVLELNAGAVERYQLKKGDKLEF